MRFSHWLCLLITLAFSNVCIASTAQANPVTDSKVSSEAQLPSEPICTFIPPTGWEIAKLINPSPFIQVGFVGKGSTVFRPSINLAYEEIDVGLKEYVKAVKEIHLSDPNTKCRDLGKFNMRAGEGRLLDITVSASHGEIKQYQAIFVGTNKAYILTIAVLKEDFPRFQKEMIQSLETLNLLSDLYSPLDEKQQEELKEFFSRIESGSTSESKKKELERMQKFLSEKYSQIGPHWHYLVLSERASKMGAN